MKVKLTAMFALIASALLISAGPSMAKVPYTFEGRLQVRLSNVQHGGPLTQPLRGVQLRVVRAKSPTKGAVGAHGMTDGNGDFRITRKFAKDRDGVGPGRKPIRFQIQARFRNAELKVRRGGTFKNNWFTVARVEGKNGQDFNLGHLTFNNPGGNHDLGDRLAGRIAQIWWVYDRMLQVLRDNNVPLLHRVRVVYPSKHVYTLAKQSSWFLHKVHLEESIFDSRTRATMVMIHELMHQWDVEHQKGEKSIVCIADAHHKSPDKWGSSRCSGYMEGFAEAMAVRLAIDYFGGSYSSLNGTPFSHEALRTGNHPYPPHYRITNRDEAERTDVGWQNFLTFFWTQNEWDALNGSVPD